MVQELEPVPQQSMLAWAFEALGIYYAALLPLAGLVSFLMVLLIVMRGKGPMAAATLVLVVHVPLLIGIFGAVHGLLTSYSMIAASPTSPKPAALAAGFSTALFVPLFAILCMIPGYLVALFGGLVRALTAKSDAT